MQTFRIIFLAAALLPTLSVMAAAGPYEDGRAAYERGDFATALRLFRPLAERGHADAQRELGLMYYRGEGVERNYSEAARWSRRAFDQGADNAMLTISLMSEAARDALKRADFGSALALYRALADQGDDDEAQFSLGVMYQFGNGVPRNYAEAANWYRRAALQGNAQGQMFLGFLYADGRGVPQDYAEAVKWYRMAAEQRDTTAQRQLGLFYKNGQGVPQDYIQAHMWLNLAAAGGDSGAAKERDALAGVMTPAQIAEAQRLARTWEPSPGN